MPATRRRHQPWYASLSVDLIFSVLQNSIFHPFVASLIPLCLRAAEVPYQDPAFINSVLYAAVVCVFWLLAPLNERLAYGRPRPVSQDDEVVVITGGASGLGHCLAEMYAQKGVDVAVVDLSAPKNRLEGVDYYQCDISSKDAAGTVLDRIQKDLGPPTVLINNAGIMVNQSLAESSSNDVQRTFNVNTLAQFDLAATFVNSLITAKCPGTLVTVSSILGRLGAANLSAYTGSKAALIAYHNSITAELRRDGHATIKTILVTPGQLSTDMFATVRQSSFQRFLGPVVEVQQLALAMTAMIGQGRGGVLAEPAYARWVAMLDVVPAGVARVLRDLAGIDTAMPDMAG